jgi:hypothetical protein
MERSDIVICVPYFGGKDFEHCNAIDAAKEAGYRFRATYNYPYIDQVRCLLAERALSMGARVVFYIDHDIVFDHKDILSMAEEAEARTALIAGLYLTRKIGGTCVVSLADPKPEEILCLKDGGLYPCAQLPGGFLAVPRRILEELPVKNALLGDGKTRVRLWFENSPVWVQTESGEEGVWGGEDMRFSQRVREAGYPLFVDTRPRLFHKGTHKFALEDGYLGQEVNKDTLKIRMVQKNSAGNPA